MKAKTIKGLPQIIPLHGYNAPNNILVVGCGGTGGHLIPHLARMVGVLRVSEMPNLQLIVADGDVVEQKNLTRQNFVTSDLGKNKAVVMAGRYSRAFGHQITAITKDIESINDIVQAFNQNYPALVIGCVDNNASRKVINEWFNQPQADYYGRFWIDSGNEETAGQVVCGFTGARYTSSICTPSVFEIFPEMVADDAKFNSQLSCADRAQSAPQNMQTNVTAATIIMNYAQKILRRQPISSHGVDFSIENVYSTRLNTKENLSKVAVSRRKNWEKHYV